MGDVTGLFYIQQSSQEIGLWINIEGLNAKLAFFLWQMGAAGESELAKTQR